MRVLLWSCRIFILLFLSVFAFQNTDDIRVRFVFDNEWQAPLFVVLSCFFIGGVVLGVLSLVGPVFRLRREIAKLKREQIPPKPRSVIDHD